MKTVSKEILAKTAKSLMFEMSELELETLEEEFKIILKQMELMGNIPGVDDAIPMVFPYEISTTFLREDVSTPSLDKETALKNASDVVDGQIRLPKVI